MDLSQNTSAAIEPIYYPAMYVCNFCKKCIKKNLNILIIISYSQNYDETLHWYKTITISWKLDPVKKVSTETWFYANYS